jgi:hypothetical protein
MVFTEQGAAMLSSVLNSDRAISPELSKGLFFIQITGSAGSLPVIA